MMGNMKNISFYIYISLLLCLTGTRSLAQRRLSLSNAIQIARQNSFDAKLAQFSFIASYWTYRSFKAQLLPSVNLTGGLLNFNHSSVEARDANTGKINYVSNNSMTNNLMLSVDQQIPSLGGTLSLQSYLYRLDQFDYDLKNYNSQPLRISYTQPLRSYNELKWKKRTAPKEYEKAKRVYLESMEDVAIQTTTLFFNAVSAQSDYNQSVAKYNDLLQLYEMSKKRFSLGTITKSDVLQLELSLLNAKVAVTNSKIVMDSQLFSLFSYLRVKDYDDVQLIEPTNIPELLLNAGDILSKALENASHPVDQDLSLLSAQQNLASAKSGRGIQLQLNGEVGFNKTGNSFLQAYRNLQDNEIVGVTLSLPIFDWGVRKGRVRVAESNLALAKTQVEQAHEAYIQSINQQVVRFGFQAEQCKLSLKAQDISKERYEITKKRFESGTISVTVLNTAIQEQEAAKAQYIGQLQQYWTGFYTLRKVTLYDWVNHRNLVVDVDNIVQ